MKARFFVILIAAILLAPAYASAQDAAGPVTYAKVGNFIYANETFRVRHCNFPCTNENVTVTVSCPAGYVALGGGFRSTEIGYRQRLRSAPSNLWADEPTKDHTGWLVGLSRIVDSAQVIGVVVTCGLASQ